LTAIQTTRQKNIFICMSGFSPIYVLVGKPVFMARKLPIIRMIQESRNAEKITGGIVGFDVCLKRLG
jgi:hypothetical protein